MNSAASTKTWFGHPRGLFVLFLTEMWERFSYYGMRALLAMYMTKSLLVGAEQGKEIWGYPTMKAFVVWILGVFSFQGEVTTQVLSSQFYGLYTGFVYLTPFFGGILADRYFGQRKSVYIGSILMAIGHFLMANESLFFLALLFLILGNGCFKPNITTQVGSLYQDGDPRRDRAYTLFYMGINLGAFLSPFICGTLGQVWGWHYGFSAAGVGMILGLVIYHFGRHSLPQDARQQEVNKQEHNQALTSSDWKKIWALVFLCAVNVVFWAVYEQQGNTLQLWADSAVNWNFFGFEVPSSWYQSFNPFFIFLFAPLLDVFWAWQSKKGKEPSNSVKMGLGSFLLALAFVVMIFAVRQDLKSGEKLSLFWLTFATWLLTMGELYLSPIGLSLVTKVAPVKILSMMMGVWFLSSFFGNYLSGWIGGYYGVISMQSFFTILMLMGFGAGLIFIAARKPLEKMMKDEN